MNHIHFWGRGWGWLGSCVLVPGWMLVCFETIKIYLPMFTFRHNFVTYNTTFVSVEWILPCYYGQYLWWFLCRINVFNLCVSLYDLMIFSLSPQIYVAPFLFLFLCVCVCSENVDGMLVICVLMFISLRLGITSDERSIHIKSRKI